VVARGSLVVGVMRMMRLSVLNMSHVVVLMSYVFIGVSIVRGGI